MRAFALIGAVLLTAATITPVLAQPVNDTVTVSNAADLQVERNKTVYDADGGRIGKVIRVEDDKSVLVIYRGKAVRIDASTMSNDADGKIVTTLLRADLR